MIISTKNLFKQVLMHTPLLNKYCIKFILWIWQIFCVEKICFLNIHFCIANGDQSTSRITNYSDFCVIGQIIS